MLRLENVSYKVDDKDILSSIDLTIEDGESVVITGHNGSGKSTLIKIIMGIITPTSGNIYLNDENITDLPIYERAKRGLTIAFQQPVKFKGLTVKNLIDTATSHSNNVSDVCDYLSKVGLCAKNYIDRELDDTLSGGELKRIEIAMAMAKGGEVYLFDEPEAGIDLWSFEELTSVFDALGDKTRVIVSHQEKVIATADRIVVLSQGKVDRVGATSEIMKSLYVSRTCARLGGDK